MRQVTALFKHWRAYHAGKIPRRTFQRRMAPVRATIDAYLLHGSFSGNKRFAGICTELVENREQLWAFIDHDGVEPTNNTAEQAVRHAVIWRRLSFGTQSMQGSFFVERMLTVIETCLLQKRSVLKYVSQAVEARVAGQTAPLLLPGV